MTPDRAGLVRRPRPLRFYRWAFPLAWLATSAAALEYPGDEYGLWGAGSLAGMWIASVAPLPGDVRTIALAVWCAGAPLMALAGWPLDALRLSRRAWLAAWLAVAFLLCLWTIGAHRSYERAVSRNGSLTAYVLFSLNFGSYLVWPGLVALGLLRRRRRARRGCCPDCGYDLTGNVTGRCPECGRAAAGAPAESGP